MCLNKAKKGYNNFKKVWEDRERKSEKEREREQQQRVHNLIGRLLKRYIRNGGSS